MMGLRVFYVLVCVLGSLLYAEESNLNNYLRRTEGEKQKFSSQAASPVVSMAQSERPAKGDVPMMDPPSRFQIGANYTYAKISPQGHSDFSGSLGGLQALYEYKAKNRIYGGLKFAWRQGSTHGSGTRTITDIDVQERIGYTFSRECAKWMISCFSGFGYRHFGEKVASVTFNYDEFYIPVGVFTDYQWNWLFAIGFDLTWMPQVFPVLTITPLQGARWILTKEIANFLAELPMTFTVSQKHHCSVIVKPFFEFWQDGRTTARTETGVTLHIPHNNYIFAGVDVNFCYAF